MRFTAVEGVLTEATATGGRGAYTCPDAGCFEQAMRRRAFSRALRLPVRVEPELVRLYTEGSHG